MVPVETNSRRIMQSEAEYYNSKGEYTSNEWDNPVLNEDSLVEMVSVNNNTMVAPDEVTNMLVDSDSIAEESRRSKKKTKELT